MDYRRIGEADTERFFRMLCQLDEETEYMLYEPGERQRTAGDLGRLRKRISAAAVPGGDLLIGAVNEREEIAGFLWAERGVQDRVRHTAYIVTGVLRAYRRQGIGDEFFRRLEDWAGENGILRLELTVECGNAAAKALYEKHGFAVEGLRKKSMKVNGRYVDEYYMGKITE